jgi:hypothetical protein
MKRLFLSAAILFAGITMHAQDAYNTTTTTAKNNFRWSIGVEPSVPVGHYHDLSSFGIGGSFQGEYQPGKLGITLNAGYIDYFGKTVDTINYADFKYWPVMAGLKLHMSGITYLHGQLGAGFGEKNLGTSFWYGAGVGFDLGKAMDLEVRYMGWKQNLVNGSSANNGYGGGTGGGGGGGYGGHYSTIGARLAYVFK